MISGSSDETLRLWNMSSYQCVTVINCCWNIFLYQIDKNRVIVSGHKTFSIIILDKCIIEKTIKDGSLGFVRCFLKMRDNKTVLCGCDKGTFCFYDMNTEQ